MGMQVRAKVWICGSNEWGQLGDGSSNGTTTFKVLTVSGKVLFTSAGGSQTFLHVCEPVVAAAAQGAGPGRRATSRFTVESHLVTLAAGRNKRGELGWLPAPNPWSQRAVAQRRRVIVIVGRVSLVSHMVHASGWGRSIG